MKKIGDLFTAIGIVGILAVVLELIIGWRMIPQSIILWFIIVSFLILFIGLIMKNAGKDKSDGKDMKQLGIATLLFGIGLLLLTFGGIFSSNTQSTLYKFVNNRFPFLIIFALIFLLIGIVLRSIGKSKETKFNEKKN